MKGRKTCPITLQTPEAATATPGQSQELTAPPGHAKWQGCRPLGPLPPRVCTLRGRELDAEQGQDLCAAYETQYPKWWLHHHAEDSLPSFYLTNP